MFIDCLPHELFLIIVLNKTEHLRENCSLLFDMCYMWNLISYPQYFCCNIIHDTPSVAASDFPPGGKSLASGFTSHCLGFLVFHVFISVMLLVLVKMMNQSFTPVWNTRSGNTFLSTLQTQVDLNRPHLTPRWARSHHWARLEVSGLCTVSHMYKKLQVSRCVSTRSDMLI